MIKSLIVYIYLGNNMCIMLARCKLYFIRSFYFIKAIAYKVKLNHQYRSVIRKKIKNKPSVLSKNDVEEIKAYYKKFGFNNVKTYWHEFYSSSNNLRSVKYVPEDLFHAVISNRFNQMRQWPTLLDKNLLDVIFKDFKQPETVIKNINGFYFDEGKIITQAMAISKISEQRGKMVIKPSIDSGNGQGVKSLNIQTNDNDETLKLKRLFCTYKGDFIIQKVVNQHNLLKGLNPSSLNTIRVLSYLNEGGAHALSAVLRIGAYGSFTDNFEAGGIACGIGQNGKLKDRGYTFNGDIRTKTNTGVVLEGINIPSYKLLIERVKKMHLLIPYFRIVSWDMGVDSIGEPVLIEYNTYHQGVTIHQLANGPLFGEFTEEILEYSGN